MKVMLEEIERKKTEAEQVRIEEERRMEEERRAQEQVMQEQGVLPAVLK